MQYFELILLKCLVFYTGCINNGSIQNLNLTFTYTWIKTRLKAYHVCLKAFFLSKILTLIIIHRWETFFTFSVKFYYWNEPISKLNVFSYMCVLLKLLMKRNSFKTFSGFLCCATKRCENALALTHLSHISTPYFCHQLSQNKQISRLFN